MSEEERNLQQPVPPDPTAGPVPEPGPAPGPGPGPGPSPDPGPGPSPWSGPDPGPWQRGGSGYAAGQASVGGPDPGTAGYPLGQHPAYPGQPTWGPPPPPPGRGGGGIGALSIVVVLALMVLAAVGGGAAGAWIYAQGDGSGAAENAGGTTVVDGPQLDYTSLASIASEVSPSVVQIQAGDGSGSGVVMSDEGYILTNAHVVEPASGGEVLVRFSNGETVSATVEGADAPSDIAVVRAQGASDLTPAPFGNSDEVLVGDTVLAIGSPLGFRGSVTQGIVSAKDRTLPVDGRTSLSGLLQTDASINPGNSGGPLVNLAGEVVGINTAIATDGQSSGFLGVGFAVPSSRATTVADQLIAGEEVQHSFLGVTVRPVDTGGALIGDVVPGGPADQAGLQPGDVVHRFGDQPVTDSSDLVNAVQSAAPGDTVEVEFERDGTRLTTDVTLEDAGD